MLRITKTAFSAVLALSTGAAGCADNESTLFVQGVLALAASDCVARPDPEAEFYVTGVFDQAFTSSYFAAVQVGNQLTQQGNREKLRTETSRMHLEGARVTLFGTGGSERSFESLATGFVHPAAGTDPGLAAVFVQLVRPEDVGNLGAEGQAIARFRVFGTTLGGQEIESGDYDFPIYVCDGCLVTYPLEARTNTDLSQAYMCGAAAESPEGSNICIFGQDQQFPCTECASTLDICRDPTLNPSLN